MKQCWPEGDLREYLDGELPLETQEQIGEHLEKCAACGTLCEQLSERASRVSNLMALLPEPGPLVMPATVKMMPVRTGRRRAWMVPALALAAALVIGFIVLPRQVAPAPTVAATAQVETPAVSPVAAAPPVTPRRRLVHQASTRSPAPHADFLRLDDEPLETATLVRVSAENGEVQADLLVGPDGRAHAIRVINNQ